MSCGPPTRALGIGTASSLAALAIFACSGGEAERPDASGEIAPVVRERPGPATAQWDVVDLLREAAAAAPHISDGGGRAWLVREPGQQPFARSATPDHFHLVYEVGPEGIATGGTIQLQVSPFWGWSTPQVTDPDARGFTEIRTEPEGIELRADTLGPPLSADTQPLAIEVTGRPLVAGDRLEIVYGAGPAGALADRYAERDSPFWIAVDGNGDGVRRFLRDSPTIDVRPGEAAGLLVTVPSVARPGETLRIVLAVVDGFRNSGVAFDGEAVFVDPPDTIDLPRSVRFAPRDAGRREVQALVREPGVYRLEVAAGPLRARSNPLLVVAEGRRVLWGDLHGHSNFSDGTGVPEDYYLYARDVSGLDVVALTDHDRWGILPLVDDPQLWREIREQTRRFNSPGRFVTLLGFEWTNWIHGHRHVLYFGDDGAVIDSLALATDSPAELWSALDGEPALSIAHHPAGGPAAIDWDVAPDPLFETVSEIVSIHGSSEAADSPGLIHEPVKGHFVRDALDRGYRLGFVGSGDRHDGHPGAYTADPGEGGLAAILSEERTREGVLHALRERRVYATNGPRILLRTALGATGMGGVIPLAPGERLTESLFVQVIGESPLDRLELIRSGRVVDGIRLEGRLEATLQRDVADLVAGEYLYVRAVQSDGGAAWSSPIFIGAP